MTLCEFGPITERNPAWFLSDECSQIEYSGIEVIRMAHIGFKRLKGQLARKGVRNPGAVAASIGRKKYGKAGMAKKAAAGRRKAKK